MIRRRKFLKRIGAAIAGVAVAVYCPAANLVDRWFSFQPTSAWTEFVQQVDGFECVVEAKLDSQGDLLVKYFAFGNQETMFVDSTIVYEENAIQIPKHSSLDCVVASRPRMIWNGEDLWFEKASAQMT